MRPIAPLLAIPVAAALLAAGCGGSAADEERPATERAASSDTTAVTIKAFQYDPDPLEIEAGTTVTWTNQDATTHTVTAGTRKQPDRKAFDGKFAQDETFEHTFDEPGTYDYYCALHSGPGMTAQVVVK